MTEVYTERSPFASTDPWQRVLNETDLLSANVACPRLNETLNEIQIKIKKSMLTALVQSLLTVLGISLLYQYRAERESPSATDYLLQICALTLIFLINLVSGPRATKELWWLPINCYAFMALGANSPKTSHELQSLIILLLLFSLACFSYNLLLLPHKSCSIATQTSPAITSSGTQTEALDIELCLPEVSVFIEMPQKTKSTAESSFQITSPMLIDTSSRRDVSVQTVNPWKKPPRKESPRDVVRLPRPIRRNSAPVGGRITDNTMYKSEYKSI